MPLHPDILKALSHIAANNSFELYELLDTQWKCRASLKPEDRPVKRWDILEIERELKAAKRDGEVCECPGGWLLIPPEQRQQGRQRSLFGE